MSEVMGDEGLFHIDAPPPVSLHDRFGMPPFSVLDRRSGAWQDRKRKWLSLGIRSELGRDGGLIYDPEASGMSQFALPIEERSDRTLQVMAASTSGGGSFRRQAQEELDRRVAEVKRVQGALNRERLNEAGTHRDEDKLNAITGQETLTGTSIFDPVLCELAYRWFSAPGMSVLDPFAGGSVRGVTAALLHRRYMGVDLRDIQVKANREQAKEILTRGEPMPRWVAGDSNEVLTTAPKESFDALFSCPPYADLEVYSDDPRDISGMEYPEFCRVHREIISKAAEALKPDRFAAWVISDVRDKRGFYRGLVAETVQAFEAAGLRLYNEAIILDPVGSAAVRAGRIFLGGRKLTRMHQHLLVFTKGDWKRATLAVSPQEIVLETPEGAS